MRLYRLTVNFKFVISFLITTTSFDIFSIHFKYSVPVDEGHFARSMSQILYLELSLYFIKST